MDEKTYRLGSIQTDYAGRNRSFPRPLLDEDDRIVAIVDCCEGPALVGPMTAADVRRRFGHILNENAGG